MASASSKADSIEFGCNKWADCSCTQNGGSCKCGSGCGCGSITVDEVKTLMKTACPYTDCKCGSATCTCGKDCSCPNKSKLKGKQDWIEMAQHKKGIAGSK